MKKQTYLAVFCTISVEFKTKKESNDFIDLVNTIEPPDESYNKTAWKDSVVKVLAKKMGLNTL